MELKFDFLVVGFQAIEDHLAGIAVHPGHLGGEFGVKTKHIVIDQELTVGVRAGAKAHDQGVLGPLSDQLADPVGDQLEQDDAGPGFFQDLCVLDDAAGHGFTDPGVGRDNEIVTADGFDWVRVRTVSNDEGWVARDFLVTSDN